MDENIDFDACTHFDMLERSRLYAEFKINCDLENIECIITEDEFNKMNKMLHDGIEKILPFKY